MHNQKAKVAPPILAASVMRNLNNWDGSRNRPKVAFYQDFGLPGRPFVDQDQHRPAVLRQPASIRLNDCKSFPYNHL
jgi:hypothetical protein